MSEFTYESILCEKREGIATITLNRPEKINAIDSGPHGIATELVHACADLEHDPEVRVVIVKGAGRGFSSGYDIDVGIRKPVISEQLEECQAPPATERIPVDWMDVEKSGAARWIGAIWNNHKPFVAQVHGFCLAAGMDLASACDILICSDDAIFGYPAVRYTSIPVTPVWVYLVGFHKAKEMVLTGNHYSAREMYDFGLVNKVVSRNQLEDEVNKLSNQMAQLSEVNQYINKSWVNEVYNIAGLQSALAYTNALGGIVHTSRPPEDLEFMRITQEKGLKAALAWRDAKFAEADKVSRELRERKLG